MEHKKPVKGYKKGGKLIHKSISSCVFQPNIPCDSKEKVSMNKLSKVMF